MPMLLRSGVLIPDGIRSFDHRHAQNRVKKASSLGFKPRPDGIGSLDRSHTQVGVGPASLLQAFVWEREVGGSKMVDGAKVK
jgi:hypothetical protein